MIKILVNFIHILLITGMIYPVYIIWNNDQTNNFCTELKLNMTKEKMFNLAKQQNIKLNFEPLEALKWQASAKIATSFSNDYCQINGMGDRIASAKIVMR